MFINFLLYVPTNDKQQKHMFTSRSNCQNQLNKRCQLFIGVTNHPQDVHQY